MRHAYVYFEEEPGRRAAAKAPHPRRGPHMMDRLEERVGPEGRKLFEQFLKQVNRLQERQRAEAAERARGLRSAQASGDGGPWSGASVAKRKR
jgi:hypothetical protein